VKLPVSALVASLDEGELLDACLASVRFCDEIVVVNLGSRDDTPEIARAHGATVVDHPPVPAVEQIHAELAQLAKHDWLLLIDPDERVDAQLVAELAERWDELLDDDQVGAVTVPWRFYFDGRPLKGTAWGGRSRILLVHRMRVTFTGAVHQGLVVQAPFRTLPIAERANNVVHHLWMRDRRQWLAKHRRYLELEGSDRYERGERVGIGRLVAGPAYAFAASLLLKGGWREGRRGVYLSLFWAWYRHRTLQALRREQKRRV
jgi:glycosyltransferase involved in cell wall biosynthesis